MTCKTGLTPPIFIEVHALSQKGEESFMCARGIDFALVYDFSIGIITIPTVWYLLCVVFLELEI